MSNFLESLNKNARTENEVAIEQKQAADRKEKIAREEYQQHQTQLKNNFDTIMKEFLEEIKESCVKAVRDACYITYNGTRYLVCSIALMWSRERNNKVYEDCYGHDDKVLLTFGCYKLEKNHILPSKQEHKIIGTRRVIGDHPSKLGCRPPVYGVYYGAPDYVNLVSDVQNNLDGYTDIHVLPKRIVNANIPLPKEPDHSDEFNRPLAKHDFLIKF